MGWSCGQRAGSVLEHVGRACCAHNAGGVCNLYTAGGHDYVVDASRTEHADGAITGSIWRSVADANAYYRRGSWRIEGDGTISRGPKWFRALAVGLVLEGYAARVNIMDTPDMAVRHTGYVFIEA